MDPTSVEVLHCPKCGADVPLGDGESDEARCVHCGAVVPLPAAHRELRRIQREDESARQRAQQLFSKLDSPPWLVTRVLAAVFDQPMFLFWLFFGVPVGLVSIFAGLIFDARLHPSFAVTTIVIFAALFVFAFVPRSLGIYANRRAGARRILVVGLAARPPKLPGGPAGCRECGAPLTVPPGATVARCAYCHADSAVEIRTPFLARAKKTASAVAHTIDEAARLDQKERAGTRRTLFREAGRYFLITSIFGGLTAVYMWDDERAKLRDDGTAPGLGIASLVLCVFLLIALMMRSMGATNERTKEEDRQRREGNDLPSWVRTFGPLAFTALLWAVRAVLW